MSRYVIERREILAAETRRHYFAGIASFGADRWVPGSGDALRYSCADARTRAAYWNQAAKRAGLFHLIFRAVPAPEGAE